MVVFLLNFFLLTAGSSGAVPFSMVQFLSNRHRYVSLILL